MSAVAALGHRERVAADLLNGFRQRPALRETCWMEMTREPESSAARYDGWARLSWPSPTSFAQRPHSSKLSWSFAYTRCQYVAAPRLSQFHGNPSRIQLIAPPAIAFVSDWCVDASVLLHLLDRRSSLDSQEDSQSVARVVRSRKKYAKEKEGS